MATRTFQLPHRSSQTESRSLSRERKRKRGSSRVFGAVSDENYYDETDVEHQAPGPPGRNITGLTLDQADQYHIVGLQPHEDIPSKPFPHSPVGWTKPRRGPPARIEVQEATEKELTDGSKIANGNTSLRQQHMNTLTAMMHRCLLEGDYQRAGEAWSLLLHSNPPLDVRRHDRWGIGAEILMRKVSLDSPGNDGTLSDRESNGDSDVGDHEPPFVPNTSYTADGLRAARSYYDMLIRRYPGQLQKKTARRLPNSVDFNPVMLNVWLYQVAFVKKKALQDLEREHGDQASGAQADQTVQSVYERSRDRIRRDRLQKLRANELREAESIAAKLNELFASPAYDRDADLRRLFDMVQAWIEDLRDGAEAQQTHNTLPA